jgi:hypothetical protein
LGEHASPDIDDNQDDHGNHRKTTKAEKDPRHGLVEADRRRGTFSHRC